MIVTPSLSIIAADLIVRPRWDHNKNLPITGCIVQPCSFTYCFFRLIQFGTVGSRLKTDIKDTVT